MTLFYSLRGALGEKHLLQEHEEAILSLLQGDYAKADVERLIGHKQVYSLRLTQQARLLFTLHQVQGKNYLLILDYLPNHDYHKTRFLKYGVLQQYLDKQKEAYLQATHAAEDEEQSLFEKISPQEFVDLVRPIQTEVQNATLDRSVLDFYQQQWIELSGEQQEILELPLPAVVTGAAGSGKSCIALSLLSAQAKGYLDAIPTQDEKEESCSLLYVTETPRLAAEMQNLWQALPIARDTPGLVRFLTYQQLLQELINFPNPTWVGFEEFAMWYEGYYLEREKNQAKIQKRSLVTLPSHLLYQEFRIASGCTEAQYCHLEADTPSSNTKRQTVYAEYQCYVNFLQTQKKIDPALYPLLLKNRYNLIIADEVQNFSPGQLKILTNLAPKKAFAAFGDPHQDTANHRSVFPFLWSLLDVKKKNRKALQLTYRSPPQVVGIANQILAFKRDLLGGLNYKGESVGIQALTSKHQGGQFFLIQEEQLNACPWLEQSAKGTNFAVVTWPQYQKEAKKRFQTDFVFTPEQIKGLEFSFVLVFKLFAYYAPLFHYANQRIKQIRKLDQKTSMHQPKEGKKDQKFQDYLNQINEIYTLCTRATQTLLLCREPTEENSVLFDLFLPLGETQLPAEFLLAPANSLEDWEKQILTLFNTGNEYNQTLAWSLFQNKFNKEKQAFEDLVAPFRAIKPPKPPQTSSKEKTQSNPETSQLALGKNLKASAKNSPVKAQQSKIATAEETQALALSKQFTSKRLEYSLRNLDFHALFLKTYLSEKDSSITLVHFLQKEPQVSLFVSCLVHHSDLLHKVTVAPILTYLTQNKLPVHEKLQHLHQAQKTFKKLLRLYPQRDPKQLDAPLFIAVQARNISFIHLLKSLGACLDQIAKDGYSTPVYKATDLGFFDVVMELQALGVNLLTPLPNGSTVLHLAAQLGHISILRELHKLQADFNLQISGGHTPAHMAADYEQIETLELLGEWGADFNKPTEDGTRPIHYAASNGNLKVLDVLIKFGAKLDLVTNYSDTAAHFAAQEGRLAFISKLKVLNAPLNLLDKQGLTPLFTAARRGQIDVVRTFHSLGLDLTEYCMNITPTFAAVSTQNIPLLEVLYECVGAKIHKKSAYGKSPIFFAVECGYTAVLAKLHELGGNINEAERDISLLACAIKHSHLGCVKYLIRKGADTSGQIQYSYNLYDPQKNREWQIKMGVKLRDCLGEDFPLQGTMLLSLFDFADIIASPVIIQELKKIKPQEPNKQHSASRLLFLGKTPPKDIEMDSNHLLSFTS